MSSFENAHHFTIGSAHFAHNVYAQGMQQLYQHEARGASHDTKTQDDQPKCHEDTRKQLLSDILAWMKQPNKETGILLMHGPAGSGKSCIARSACFEAAKEGLIGASFFFWRSDSQRNNIDKFVFTLAYQLAIYNKTLRQHILRAMEQSPDIVDKPLEKQFETHILNPSALVAREDLQFTTIVIDGLDECVDETMQVSVLELLAKVVRQRSFPVGIFITSRPERHIQETIDSKKIIFATQIISLNSVADTSQDIRTVLESGFTRILNDPRFSMALRSVSRPWPSPQDVQTLVERSSRQFIYAATVLKYVASIDYNPAAQLVIVLGTRNCGSSSSPLDDLDLLYYEILSRVRDPLRSMDVLGCILAIQQIKRGGYHPENEEGVSLAKAVIYNQQRLLIVVKQLLNLPRGEGYYALNQLYSVISLKVGSTSFRHKSIISFYHKSFQDFLYTKQRSKNFYLNKHKIHGHTSQACLRILSLEKYETPEEHMSWIYSHFRWMEHFLSSRNNNEQALRTLQDKNNVVLKKCYRTPPYILISSTSYQEALGKLELLDEEVSKPIIAALRKLPTKNTTLSPIIETIREVNNLSYTHVNMRKPLMFLLFRTLFISFGNDALIGGLLAVHAILRYLPFDQTLSDVVLTDAGLSAGSLQYPLFGHWAWTFREFMEFLSSRHHSGSIYCAPEDYANAYVYAVANQKLILSCGRRNDWGFVLQWAFYIEDINPSLTPSFWSALETAGNLYLNDERFTFILTHDAEVRLFNWFGKLCNPPEAAINSWKKAFQKARFLTQSGGYGYTAFFSHATFL